MGYTTRTTQRVGVPGCWILPMPAPTVHGFLGRDDMQGIRVGDAFVARLRADPITGAPAESTMALVERAATLHGTAAPFYFVY